MTVETDGQYCVLALFLTLETGVSFGNQHSPPDRLRKRYISGILGFTAVSTIPSGGTLCSRSAAMEVGKMLEVGGSEFQSARAEVLPSLGVPTMVNNITKGNFIFE